MQTGCSEWNTYTSVDMPLEGLLHGCMAGRFPTSISRQMRWHVQVMSLLEIVHELTNNFDSVLGLMVVHRNSNGIRWQAQRMRSDVQPTKVVVGLGQKLFNQFVILS